MLAAACYQPAIPSGVPCSQSRECPGQQACIEGVCGGMPSSPDAKPPDAPGPDAPPGTMVVVAGADPSQLRDTELWSEEPLTGHGGDNHFSVDTAELGLVRFDLSMVPPGATVLKATLGLRTLDEASEDGGTVLVFRLREGWDEAEATWNERMAGKPWATDGALPPSRDPMPLADLSPQQVFTPYQTELPPELVQEWLAQPQTNFGIAIARGTSSQHVHLRSRESSSWSTLTLELR